MKYLLATLYLIAGVGLPVVYINVTGTGNIQGREWILIATLFVFCTAAGAIWLFTVAQPSLSSNNKTREEDVPVVPPPVPEPKASTFKTPLQAIKRKVSQPVAQPRVAPMPSYQRPKAMAYPPSLQKPELETLMEDVKNLIKLESWLMALHKANELIHYYPDSPEATKVRNNLNFLIQKTRKNN